MPKRRIFIVLAAALVTLPLSIRPGYALTDASAFVQTNGEKILDLAPKAVNDSSARQQLLALVNEVLDVNGIARFALGPYVRQATPQQMKTYLKVFHQVISNGVTARLSAYAEARFTMGREVPEDGDTLVETTIRRPGSPPADVNWLVGDKAGSTKILDVIAEGTSLRTTERSDYTSYLQSHGGSIDALIAALKHQAGQE